MHSPGAYLHPTAVSGVPDSAHVLHAIETGPCVYLPLLFLNLQAFNNIFSVLVSIAEGAEELREVLSSSNHNFKTKQKLLNPATFAP